MSFHKLLMLKMKEQHAFNRGLKFSIFLSTMCVFYANFCSVWGFFPFK